MGGTIMKSSVLKITFDLVIDGKNISVTFVRAPKGSPPFEASNGYKWPHRWTVVINGMSWKTSTRQVAMRSAIIHAESYIKEFTSKPKQS